MGEFNRANHIAKLNYEQPKSMPSKRYEYYAGGRGSNKDIAMLARAHEHTTGSSDPLDALKYSTQSLNTTGSILGTSITTVTEGVLHSLGSSLSSEPTLATRLGEMAAYEGNVDEMARQRILGRQSQDLMHCMSIFSKTFHQLTERRINLDNSNLRTTEPFDYRIRMNELDDLFMFVIRLMDSMTPTTRPEQLRERLTERGLMEWQL